MITITNLGNNGLVLSYKELIARKHYGKYFNFYTINPLFVSSILCGLFLIQYVCNIAPQWLLELQGNLIYKQISGIVLLSIILYQWRLGFTRVRGIKLSRVEFGNHRLIGAVVPLVYYIHSIEFGFAYQSVLSIGLLLNCLLGACNPAALKIKQKHYYASWLILHISLAFIVLPLSVYHIYIVYAY